MEPIFEIKEESKKDNYNRFVISPLPAGFGNTLGIALRRVLLSSLKGGAITKVRISGVKHQFSTLKGMKEDVLDFLLNLKKVRLSISDDKPVKLSLAVSRAGDVKASDIKTPSGVNVANGDLVLATLAKGAKLEVEMEAQNGTGYSPSEEREKEVIGLILLDATFSPVTRVNYKVEETRVGRVTNFDRLTLEIWTDVTLTGRQALTEASKTLMAYFAQIFDPKKVSKKLEKSTVKTNVGGAMQLSVEEIGLPTRIANALAKAGFETVEKLLNAPREELMKVRNLGEKSLKIIKAALMEKGIKFENA